MHRSRVFMDSDNNKLPLYKYRQEPKFIIALKPEIEKNPFIIVFYTIKKYKNIY